MTDSPQASPASATVPVVCDQCRATGIAGDETFSAIPDILAFVPVPRRAHVNNWTPEHQRAFIAALAITGSPRQAARALGRHMFGAQQLRTARGGKGFDAAWDAAMEIARDREFAQIQANLSTLSAERDASEAGPGPPHDKGRILPRLNDPHARPADLYGETIDEEVSEERRAIIETRLHIRDKLTRARRLLLLFIGADPAKRAAWEVLVGPVDWDRASRCESQADEPFADPQHEHYEGHDIHPHCMTKPDMLLTAERGLLAEITGGEDVLAPLREAIANGETGEEDEEQDDSADRAEDGAEDGAKHAANDNADDAADDPAPPPAASAGDDDPTEDAPSPDDKPD